LAAIEVENTLAILEVLSRICNLLLLLTLTYPVSANKKSNGEKIRLFWKVIFSIPIAAALLLIWVLSFLISPLFVPSIFQFELFNEIVTNWAGIIFPVIPAGLLIFSLLVKYYPPIRQSFRDDFISRNGGDQE